MTALINYDPKLEKDYWNKKKGNIAKTAGKTGVGEALHTLRGKFDAIDWDAMNTKPPSQLNYTPKVWQDALNSTLAACDSKEIKATKKAADDVKAATDTALKKFKESKLKALISKSDTVLAQDIGAAAEALKNNLDLTVKKKSIQDSFDTVRTIFESAADQYKKDLANSVTIASKRLGALAPQLNAQSFNTEVQLIVRGVHTQLSKASSIGKGVVDAAKAKSLTDQSKAWADHGANLTNGDEAKSEFKKVATFLKEARELAV